MCVCVCVSTGGVKDVIHGHGCTGVTGGDLRSPIRHQAVLIGGLQLQAVLDPRSEETHTHTHTHTHTQKHKGLVCVTAADSASH